MDRNTETVNTGPAPERPGEEEVEAGMGGNPALKRPDRSFDEADRQAVESSTGSTAKDRAG